MTKELDFHTGKVTTQSKEGGWSTAFEFAPPLASDKAARGVMMAAVSITASPNFDIELAGRQVLSTLQENYYAQTTGGVLPALERAVTAAHQRLITLVFSGAETEDAIDFNLVVGVLWGSVFYLAQLGDGRAVIRRNGELKWIGRKQDAQNEDLTVGDKPDIRTASGEVEQDEKIVLATPRFYDLIPADNLGEALSQKSTWEGVEKLKPRIKEEPTAAAIIISLGKSEDEPGAEPVVISEPITPESESAPSLEEATAETPPLEPESLELPNQPTDEIAKDESATELDSEEKPDQPHPEESPIVPANAELSSQAKLDFKKYTDMAQGLFSKVTPLTNRAIERTRHLSRNNNLMGRVRRLANQVWEQLGSPRTAVENISEAKNRRTLLILAGALLVILLISIGVHSLFGGGGNKAKFDNLISQAQAEYNQAQPLATSDKSQAKSLLSQASTNLTQAGQLNVDNKKVQDLQSQVATLLSTVNQEYSVNPAVFYDLTTLHPGASGAALAGDKTTLYVLDPSGGLYQLPVATKSGVVLSSDLALAKGSSLAVMGNFVFNYVPSQGVYGYDLKTKKFSHTSSMDPAWGKITGMTGYTNFIYLLDSGNSKIWRYAPISAAQFGPSAQWLKDGTSLQDASSVVVDGSVWVAQGGKILKLTLGKLDSFTTQGVTPALAAVKFIYTDVNTTNLYLLEAGRVVVVDKSGNYVAQYKSDQFNQASAMVVDEAGLKAYILAGKDIYQLDLKP